MGIETFEYIDDLVSTNPTSTDNVSEGDNHIRGIKTTLKNTFPSLTGAVSATQTELNILDGVTTTTAQLNYLNTASSNIQSQLDAKLVNVVEDTTPQLGGDLAMNGNNINAGDATTSTNRIRLGASYDLQMFHDGNNSYVTDNGTGGLFIQGSGNIVFRSSDGGETYATFNDDGACTLRYDNSIKLATTSTGIDVTGTITCDGLDLGDNSVLNVGIIALDTIKGDADDNTNITFAGNDYTYFYQGGTNVLTVSTTGVNVTGTVTADGLTVDGDVTLTDATPSITIKRSNTANEIGFTFLNSNDVESFKYSIDGNANDMTFESRELKVLKIEQGGDISFYEDTGTTAKLFWDASAESLGIGTTSPSATLDIQNVDTNYGYSIKANSSSTANLYIGHQSSGANNRMTISHNYLRNGSGYVKDDNGYGVANIQFIDGSLRFGTDSSSGNSYATERMQIDSSGNVLFNTTTKFTTAPIQIKQGALIYACASTWHSATSGTRVHLEFRDGSSASSRGSITTNGSSTSYNTSSDYRLKENIVDMDSAIDRVKALQPRRFNWVADEDDTVVDGFIAHEVSDVVPEAIFGEKDAVDDEGNPEYQGIDQSKLVPLLTGALQEAIAKIEALETRIETLEGA